MDDLSLIATAIVVSMMIVTNLLVAVLFVIALWRFLVGNRLAEVDSIAAYRQGSPWNTRHGMVFDPATGMARPDDGPVIIGQRSVLGPLIIGCIGYVGLHYSGGLLLPWFF